LTKAMLDPSFYPHRPARVELVETHISWVFLAGELVYKLRKPVVLPFLDYGTLERRREMSFEEVRLGRPLAPRVYRGVRAIVRDGEGFALAGPDADGACEYVVELARFDAGSTLAHALAGGTADAADMQALGELLARFHAGREPVLHGWWAPAQVAATVAENFHTLLALRSAVGRSQLWVGDRFAAAFLHAHHDLFASRVAGGHIRECHGDLRAEHVILGPDIQIFDPVEFDRALRLIDVSADVAFLVMDLESAGRDDLARELMRAYRRAGGDAGPDSLLFFYAAYRAWVRAKVAAVRADELQDDEAARAGALDEARRLAELGRRLAWRARRPLVLVVCGPAATGKTSLAEALADLSGLRHLSSDRLRKELAGVAATERAPASTYRPELSLETYEQLGRRAAEALAGEGGAIVDATFRRTADREAFRSGLGDNGEQPTYIHCLVPALVADDRARSRERSGAGLSDATAEIARRQRHEWEPLDEVPARSHLLMRTDRPLSSTVDHVEAALDSLLELGGLAPGEHTGQVQRG
jgi:aminoglycoside phosphotransferase family enzyme/predicted kinase